MAIAPTAGTVKCVGIPGFLLVTCKLTPSGSYATNGDTLDFTAAAFQNAVPVGFFPPGGVIAPDYIKIHGTTGDTYGYVDGASVGAGKVKISTTSATELGAGAYNARFTSDVNIRCMALFKRI